MREELLKLFSDYLEDADYLDKQQQLMLIQLAMEGEKILPFWYACYKCINQLIEKAELQEYQLSFYIKDKCYLIWNNQKLILEQDSTRELIAHYIDIFEPIYPLGTVVELSLDFSKFLNLKNQNQRVKVVIVERFVATNTKESYFPYVGIVYPVGMLGHGKCVQFTRELINSVVHMGYQDAMEDTYVLLMKKELILDNNAVSFGFVEQSRVDELKEKIGGVYGGKDRN